MSVGQGVLVSSCTVVVFSGPSPFFLNDNIRVRAFFDGLTPCEPLFLLPLPPSCFHRRCGRVPLLVLRRRGARRQALTLKAALQALLSPLARPPLRSLRGADFGSTGLPTSYRQRSPIWFRIRLPKGFFSLWFWLRRFAVSLF